MVAVLAASAVGFCFLLNRTSDTWQPIAEGREFSASEVAAIQTAWRQAGLKSFRRDARRLLVPTDEAARYTAALPKLQRDDNDSDDERGSSIAKANLFTSHEQLEQIKDNDLRATLRRHLKAIPSIADADVIFARGKGRSAFASRSKVTATIVVLPRDGHDLTPELAQSLRTAVAGMISDLSAEDIVVLDQSTGLTVSDDSEPLLAEQRRRQHERLARQLESRIATALNHLPCATVQAKLVEVHAAKTHHIAAKPTFSSAIAWTADASDNLVEFLPLTATDDKAHSLPTMTDSANSGAWHIAVQIPQASFEAHVVQQSLSAEHRGKQFDELCDEEYARLRELVKNQLPNDAMLAELSIEPRAVNTAMSPSVTSFAAWPHVVCGLLSVLCLTVAARRWRGDAAPPSRDPSMNLTPLNADSVSEQTPFTHEPIVTHITQTSPLEPLTDLARLQQLDPQTLADALRQERPQAIAVLLTRFSTRLASACLSRFASHLQTDVIRRLKSLGEVPDELVAEIAGFVCQRIAASTEAIAHETTNRIAHLLPESPTQRVCA
jgi:hypothetical protein